MAWLPITSTYLLGKLTVNKLVVWLLVIFPFAGGTITTTVNGVETTHTILPENISKIITDAYPFVIYALFIYAIVKYNRLKKYKNSSKQSVPQQQVSNQSTVVSNESTRSQVDNESVTANLTQNQSDDPFDNWM